MFIPLESIKEDKLQVFSERILNTLVGVREMSKVLNSLSEIMRFILNGFVFVKTVCNLQDMRIAIIT